MTVSPLEQEGVVIRQARAQTLNPFRHNLRQTLTQLDSAKAAKVDLTNISQTSPTCTVQNGIPAGTYFYLDGVLTRATAAISENAPFTSSNCETVTAGGLNEINEKTAGIIDRISPKIRIVSDTNVNSFTFDVGTSTAATAFLFNGNQSVCGYFALDYLTTNPTIDYRNLSGSSESWSISRNGTQVTITRGSGTMWGTACLIIAFR